MAVYTEVTDDALASFLAEYDIGTAIAFRGIAEGVENSNYTLRTTAGDYILTLYEKRVNPADLPWFLGLMTHLAQHGIVCPLPVPARDGQALRMLAGKHAAITTFLPGVWPRRVRQEHCGPLGNALAALHLAGANYPPTRANALGPSAWAPLLARSLPGADSVHPGLGAELQAAHDSILARWPSNLPVGHIHADLFPDNVFFLDGELSGAEPATTNNRMELTAAAEALESLKRPCQVVLHTDSQYLKDGITRWTTGWVRKNWRTASGDPVKNMDLWRRVLDAAKPHQIDWRWVRGHDGNPMNERVDVLATAALEKPPQ